jgi:hypothetical protein
MANPFVVVEKSLLMKPNLANGKMLIVRNVGKNLYNVVAFSRTRKQKTKGEFYELLKF